MSEATSIDDLLGGEADEPTDRPPSSASRVWRRVRIVFAALALTAVTAFGLRLSGLAVSPLVVFGGWFAALLVRRFAAALTPPPPPRRVRRHDVPDDDRGPVDRGAPRGEIGRWERALGWADGDRDRFNERVLPSLREVADERLRQRHGCTRRSDPRRARELLGEPLWHLLDGPARRTPSPRDYTAIVAQLEKL